MSDQSAKRKWDETVAEFIESSAKLGLDYRSDDVKRNDLDMFVKTLANNSANNDKSMVWFLETADKMVRVQHGLEIKPQPGNQNKETNRKTVS